MTKLEIILEFFNELAETRRARNLSYDAALLECVRDTAHHAGGLEMRKKILRVLREWPDGECDSILRAEVEALIERTLGERRKNADEDA